MSNDLIEKLIWVLIYGGLLVTGTGLAVRDEPPGLRAALLIGGGVLMALGVSLIWVRARRDKPR